jgi:hypothetical protein
MISRSGSFTTNRFRTLLDRMVQSARLNSTNFLSLKEDPTATGQALVVLALAGTSFGIGFTVSVGVRGPWLLLGAGLGAVIGIVLGFVWTSLTFLIGTKVFHATLDYWSLARPMFFASSPGVVFLLMSIPSSFVTDIARAVGIAWIAISTVIAVRTALGIDNQRSLLTFILVTLIVLISYGLVTSLLPF